ncbi:sensor histidine kinase [Nocardioides renjunii]|uniref:sensor histidine kinase n=1 Tax=Nocardioides renjunii TaxID=3095075 RepID=UPI002AFF18DE|nr:histidine kinase [Nocardioides sp. S-34]WQQ24472.1 histidine kinase [Nocardioides sp. S-34]
MDEAARRAAPLVVTVLVVIGAILSSQRPAVALAGATVAILVTVALAVRAASGWTLALGLSVAAAGVAVVCHDHPANLGWFTICVLVGWCAFAAPAAIALTFGGVLMLGFVGQWLVYSDESGWGAWIAGTAFTAVACIFARRQRVLLDQLREAQAGLADRTRAEERNRIAAEMHDVIGHALTVSLLHVSSARLAMDEEPAEARASLEEAERLARRSLEEVRASVGLMRSGPADAAPLPGAGDLSELVESYRRAGAPVSLRVVGDPGALHATASLATYRIAQEALTNAVRHAPGARTEVELRVEGDATRLTVDSDGPPGRRTPDGVGLASMRERAEAVGGRLAAGPAGTGWRVEAVLPG